VTSRVRHALGRVALIYLLFGVVFVAGTEVVLASTDNNDFRIAMRLLFLALSTILLIVLVRRELIRRLDIEDRLMHAQQHESLARMAGGVAHDFNNMLTVILGYTDLVMRDLGPDHPATADLEAVRRSGEQARSLVDQLLTLSRHRVVQPVHVNPRETISSLREVIRRLVGDEVEVDVLLFEVPDVLIDPGQLEQVILNLAVNARDAMPDGGQLTLATSTGRLPNQQISVDLRITDSGTGMDPDTAARCFEPFFTTKDRTEGTGLGLATVAAIVERAGGRVDIDSELGRGTTFLVQLPAVAPSEAQAAHDLEAAGGAEHVLIVEDDDKVRSFARRVLEQNGYITRDAANGVEALTLLRAGEHADLVVTDVLMPAMGGVELAEQMHDVVPDTPVLFVSGYAEDPRIHKMSSEVPFLAKPFSPPDLLRAVRHALDAAPGAAQGSNR
jgi:signal transduction histidine kinase/ActR/RegA family two-component response regulator